MSAQAETELATMLAGWSERGAGTLSRRLAAALRGLIEGGLLAPGSRLPSERNLAADLAVSRGTVTGALDELRTAGLLRSRTGQGTEVQGRAGTVDIPQRLNTHFLQSSTVIDLAMGNPPDASHLPPMTLDIGDLVAFGAGPGINPQGSPVLINAVVEHRRSEGLPTTIDQVHITNGSHHGLYLVANALIGRGDRVVVEDPVYPGALDIVDHLGAEPVALPRGLAGPDPHRLAAVMAEHRPALVYLQGGVHNPVGTAASATRWRQVARVLDDHPEATVVEDRALIRMTDPGDRPPPLTTLCRRSTVVTLESMGKVGWAGLRIGWLIAPPAIVTRTVSLRAVTDLGTAVPAQIIAARLLPTLDELAAERRRVLRSAARRVVARLAEEVADWRLETPRGGSALWIELPVPDSRPLAEAARRNGVKIVPGHVARIGDAPDPHIRLCVDRPDAVVDEGISRLLMAWRELRSPGPSAIG
ncbi:MAG: PLP-dependent aminotransferase family protein [Acidimicrobiales bacterium]|nr:PLP-dependent aminotransferase family protein [Acidimicrobiales bacterium]